MDELPLKIRFADFLKATPFDMPIIIATILIYSNFTDGFTVEFALFHVIPVILAIWLGVAVFLTRTSLLTLSRKGFSFYGDWYFIGYKKIEKTWAEPVRVKEMKWMRLPGYAITDPVSGQSVMVPKVVFSYPEVSRFISEHVPFEHEVRKCIELRPRQDVEE